MDALQAGVIVLAHICVADSLRVLWVDASALQNQAERESHVSGPESPR